MYKQSGRRLDETAWDNVASQSCLLIRVLSELNMDSHDVAFGRFIEGDYSPTLQSLYTLRVPGSLTAVELRGSAIGLDLLGPLPIPEEDDTMVSIMGQMVQADLDVPALVT